MPYLEDKCHGNKDHQRMIVDSMLMIVYNLRSFLTAVTPTAVTPTAVAQTAVILLKFSRIYLNVP
jgi:hypothetical protein